MHKRKALIAAALASVFLAGTVSTASAARWHYRGGYHGGYYHRGPGPVLGLLGAAVVGAATIATAPIALLADATHPAPPPPPAYYGPPQGYEGYGPGAYQNAPPPPPAYYGRNYAPPPGYYGGY